MSLHEQFQQRGPWITRFNVEGEPLGGAYDAIGDGRFAEFRQRYTNLGRVLELGCLEGGHTIPLSEMAEHVVAIDSRAANIEKAEFVRDVYQRPNVSFLCTDLERDPLDQFGRFDLIFNLGVLYHLPEPWILLEKLARLSDRMFLWTHIAPWKWSYKERGGYRGVIYEEGGVADPLSGMSDTSFWPTKRDLLRMLAETGFDDCEIINVENRHAHGPAILLDCRSSVPACRPNDQPMGALTA